MNRRRERFEERFDFVSTRRLSDDADRAAEVFDLRPDRTERLGEDLLVTDVAAEAPERLDQRARHVDKPASVRGQSHIEELVLKRLERVSSDGGALDRADRVDHAAQIEADHGQLKSRLRPMRGLKRDHTSRVIVRGHALMQNLRRGHNELGIDTRRHWRVATAFTELARVV